MQKSYFSRIGIACFSFFCSMLILAETAHTQESEKKQTVEPVFRVPKIARVPDAMTDKTADSQVGEKPATENGSADSQTGQTNATADSPDRVADARAVDAATSKTPVEKKAGSVVPSTDLADSKAGEHPLDRAITIARDGLQNMQANIHDYTAIMVKRERINNKLTDPVYMKIKIRNPRNFDEKSVPFSIYMKFIKPRAVAGREVIWIDGQNNNKLIAHEPGRIRGFRNFHLEPTGFLAMQDNRYPIYDAGLENLVIKLVEKAERDREAGMCEVRYLDGAQINKRPCQLIEVIHDKKLPPFEFYKAKVYVDQEMNIPVRYIAYDWPLADGKPRIIEEYTYINVKLNPGLTDEDFSIVNAAYDFAR